MRKYINIIDDVCTEEKTVTFVSIPTFSGGVNIVPRFEEKKEDNMNENLQRERSYLDNRLHMVSQDKTLEMKKTYGLADDDHPSSLKEIVERIQAGKFVLPKKNEDEDPDDDRYFDLSEALYDIRWRDPSKEEDKDGYKAAKEIFDKKRTEVKDAIFVKTPAEGLEALKAFEAEKL